MRGCAGEFHPNGHSATSTESARDRSSFAPPGAERWWPHRVRRPTTSTARCARDPRPADPRPDRRRGHRVRGAGAVPAAAGRRPAGLVRRSSPGWPRARAGGEGHRAGARTRCRSAGRHRAVRERQPIRAGDGRVPGRPAGRPHRPADRDHRARAGRRHHAHRIARQTAATRRPDRGRRRRRGVRRTQAHDRYPARCAQGRPRDRRWCEQRLSKSCRSGGGGSLRCPHRRARLRRGHRDRRGSRRRRRARRHARAGLDRRPPCRPVLRRQ